MFANQRLYLTADKERLVPEGDKDAATLYATPGDEIPDSAVEKFGLVDGALPDAAADTDGAPKRKPAKAVKGGSTKEAPAGDNKGAGDAGGDAPTDPAPVETPAA